MQLDRGLDTSAFVTDPMRGEANLENPRIFLHDGKLSKMLDVLPVLEFVNRTDKNKKRPLFIIAETVEGQALATLVVNKTKGGLVVATISYPGTHERRQGTIGDLQAVVGGLIYGPYTGLAVKDLTEESFGTARQIVVGKGTTTVIGGGGNKKDLEARVRYLKKLMEPLHEGEVEKIRDRLAALTGGVATIKVGGATEIDQKEREARYEDAVCACRAALEEGVLPGGGVALVRAAATIDERALPEDERPAVRVVQRALEAPARQIAANAGVDAAVVIDKVLSGKDGFGYDAAKDRFGDLFEAGVIDPAKVVRAALENAASIAALLLATESSIAEAPVQPQKDYLDAPRPDIKNYRPRAH
jgi:chaperonin GroEL